MVDAYMLTGSRPTMGIIYDSRRALRGITKFIASRQSSVSHRQICTKRLQRRVVVPGERRPGTTHALHARHAKIAVVHPLVAPAHQVPGKGIEHQPDRFHESCAKHIFPAPVLHLDHAALRYRGLQRCQVLVVRFHTGRKLHAHPCTQLFYAFQLCIA